MDDMPPAVERPMSPGWGGSTANGWGGISPGPWDRDTSANDWGANAAGGGWGGGGGGWASGATAAPSANGWGGAASTGGGWGDSAGAWNSNDAAEAGGWGVGNVAGGSSATFIPPPPGATYATGSRRHGRPQAQEQENLWNRYPSGASSA